MRPIQAGLGRAAAVVVGEERVVDEARQAVTLGPSRDHGALLVPGIMVMIMVMVMMMLPR
jgi:hypothetical protein